MTAYEDMGVTSHTQEEKNKNKFSTYGTSIRRNDEKHPFPSYFAIYITRFFYTILYTGGMQPKRILVFRWSSGVLTKNLQTSTEVWLQGGMHVVIIRNSEFRFWNMKLFCRELIAIYPRFLFRYVAIGTWCSLVKNVLCKRRPRFLIGLGN